MKRDSVIGWAALHAFGAAVYVLLLVGFITFVLPNGPDTPVTGAGFLLLFCFSAALMASLVFGRPVLWYLDGRKKEAVRLAAWTIGFLFVAALVVLFFPAPAMEGF